MIETCKDTYMIPEAATCSAINEICFPGLDSFRDRILKDAVGSVLRTVKKSLLDFEPVI